MTFRTSAMVYLVLAIIILTPLVASADPGCITSNGNLLIESTGIYEVEIGGPTQCFDYDSINVLGTTTFDLGSIIDVNIINGYSPTGTFEILTSVGAITDNGIDLDPSDMSTFSLTVNANNVVLTAIGAGLTGDFDGDNDVDGADFLLWQRGGSPSPLSPTDLADWQANYGAGTLLSAAAVAVPEPSCIMLLNLGALAALGWRRSPRRQNIDPNRTGIEPVPRD